MIVKYTIHHCIVAMSALIMYLSTLLLINNNRKDIRKYIIIMTVLIINSLLQCVSNIDPFSQFNIYSVDTNVILRQFNEFTSYVSMIELTIEIYNYNLFKKILFRISYLMYVGRVVMLILNMRNLDDSCFHIIVLCWLLISLVNSINYINLVMIYHNITLLNGDNIQLVQYYYILIYLLLSKELIELLNCKTIHNWINPGATGNNSNNSVTSNISSNSTGHTLGITSIVNNLSTNHDESSENSLSEGTTINTYTQENMEISVPYDLHINTHRSPVKVTFNI